MLPLQGARVRSLVGELRSPMPLGQKKKVKKIKSKVYQNNNNSNKLFLFNLKAGQDLEWKADANS